MTSLASGFLKAARSLTTTSRHSLADKQTLKAVRREAPIPRRSRPPARFFIADIRSGQHDDSATVSRQRHHRSAHGSAAVSDTNATARCGRTFDHAQRSQLVDQLTRMRFNNARPI